MILSCKTYFLIFVLFKTLKNNIFYSVVHMHWTVAERTPQAGYNIFAWKLVVASGKTVLVQMVVNSAWWINVVNVLWPSTVWVHLKSTLAEIRQRPKRSLMTECHILQKQPQTAKSWMVAASLYINTWQWPFYFQGSPWILDATFAIRSFVDMIILSGTER